MNNFDFSIYDDSDIPPISNGKISKDTGTENKKNVPFDFNAYDPSIVDKEKLNEEESFGMSMARTLTQIPLGALEMTAPAILASVYQFLGSGAALDDEEIDLIERASEKSGIPFDREAYIESVHEASKFFPTVSNIAKHVEEQTGLPLEPKTKFQKAVRLAGSAGKIQSGTAIQKGVAATTAPAISYGAQEAGVPEPIADIIGLVTGGVAGAKTPTISKEIKPSGMPKRQFEDINEPKIVKESTKQKIAGKIEEDFKKVSDEIIENAPIAETREKLLENPSYKSEMADKFQKVEKLAENLTEKVHTQEIKDILKKDIKKREGTGLSSTEYDKDYKKFMEGFIEDTKKGEATASDLVTQYRKNNRALSEQYEPGASRAYNRAKKDALQEYNRTISDVIETIYPESEFSNLFKNTNREWSKISDAEAINDFLNGLFDGSIDYKSARKFFDNKNMSLPFKRGLGEEGYKSFETTMKDMLKTEKPYQMLKVAKEKGWGSLASTASSYILHPKFAMTKLAVEAAKETYNNLFNFILDKPKYTLVWENAVESLKKGDFKNADKYFSKLNDSINNFEEKND